MKIGLCAGMNVSDLTMGGSELAPELRKIGYDYIELSLSHLTMLKQGNLDQVLENLTKAGISCESCNNFFPSTLKLTGPDFHLKNIAKYAKKALNTAAFIGAKIVVFGSGAAKMFPDGYPKEVAYKQLINICQVIDPIAKDLGILIVLEPLRKAECNLINTVEEALRLMEDAKTKNIHILADYYHMRMEEENLDILLKAGENLRHVHFAKVYNRSFPLNIEEDNHYEDFFLNLKKIGYNQRISIEAYTSDFYSEAKQSISFMKNILVNNKYQNFDK
jgi:sugar phosphate isomerase/epimerase